MKRKALFDRDLKSAADRIRGAETVLIASHVNPDGDTIGSLLALGVGLLHLGKRVVMVSPDGMPARFQFLPASDLVLGDYRGRADVAVAVDCGCFKLLGSVGRAFRSARSTIQIDHHDFGEGFCDILAVDPEAAAVGEIVYDLLKLLGVKITPAIATCLLTSIIVDTGAFRFSNVRSRTFRICADLLEKGVDLKFLIEEAYWKKTLPTIRLEAKSVGNMRFEAGGKVVWTLVRRSQVERAGGMTADLDGAADVLRSIEGVRAAALLREEADGRLRVSLRSGLGVNVARIAQEFGGGGHHHAAGCTIRALASDRERLIELLREAVG